MTKAITIKPSLQEISERIKRVLDDPVKRRQVLTRAVLELKDRAAAYPPEGAWNKYPGTKGNGRWYQRGYGARWATKGYDPSSNSFMGVHGVNNSQKLQKSWRTEVQQQGDFTASAFTEVTYAPFLLDKSQQVNWAPLHGWKTIDEISEEYAPRFEEIALKAIDENIDKI